MSVFLYELSQQTRTRTFWFVVVFFGAMGWVLMNLSGNVAGGGNIYVNAPSNITLYTTLMSLFGMFLVAAMVSPSVSRDFELGTWEVVFSCPLSRRRYLLGRFLGSFTVACLAFCSILPGMMLGAHGPFAEDQTGPLRMDHYLYALAVFGFTNIFVVSCFLFAVSTLFRNNLFAYAGAVTIWVLYGIGYAALNSETAEPYVFLLDPFGMNVTDLETRYWTPFEMNNQVVPLTGDLLLNRLVWLAAGFAVLAWTLLKFNPWPRSQKARETGDEREIEHKIASRSIATQVQGAAAAWQQLFSRLFLEVRSVMRSVPFWVMLIFAFLSAYGTSTFVDPVFGSPLMSLTPVLVDALGNALVITLLVVITYYAGELVWRERVLRVDQIVDATPTRSWVLALSKLVSLWMVVLVIVGVTAAAMIILQFIKGTPIDWAMYAKELGYQALPYLWICVLAIFLQVLAPNKYLGMGLMLIYLALSLAADAIFDAPNLILFGTHPGHNISALANSNLYILEGLKYDLYWASLSVFLGLLIVSLWSRGTDEGARARIRKGVTSLHKAQVAAAVLFLAMFVALGRGLYLEDFKENPVSAAQSDQDALAAQYEELMRPLENKPIPKVRSLVFELDTYIEDRKIRSRGDMTIENRSSQSFSELIVGSPMDAKVHKLRMGGARVVKEYPQINHKRFEFDQPMAPGDELTISFDYEMDHSEYPGGAPDERLETSGTVLSWVIPGFGYNEYLALSDPDTREDYGLPKFRATRATLEESWGRRFTTLYPQGEFIDLDATMSVDRGQTGFVTGELVDSWHEGDRSFFRYQSRSAPVFLGIAPQQGVYDSVSEDVDGISLSIHYHPEHDYHIEDFIRNFSRSVRYFNQSFGRYPYDEFRITQRAGGAGAAATTTQLVFGEYAGFVSDFDHDKDVDWGTHVIGHEVGHNWWGAVVMSARTEGSHTLQETLAQYCGLMLLEKTHGRGMVGRMLRYSLKTYHGDRNESEFQEVPLLRSVNETGYVHYWKGAPVIYGVKELIGEDALNSALRAYYEKWKFAQETFPTSLDLFGHILEHTPVEYHATISDYFERILMHDLRVTSAQVEEMPDGRFKVLARLHTAKFERSPDGRESKVGIHEPIQIVLVDSSIDEKDRYSANLLTDVRRWITEEETLIELIVDQRPAAVIVDPYHNFIERNFDDNVKRI